MTKRFPHSNAEHFALASCMRSSWRKATAERKERRSEIWARRSPTGAFLGGEKEKGSTIHGGDDRMEIQVSPRITKPVVQPIARLLALCICTELGRRSYICIFMIHSAWRWGFWLVVFITLKIGRAMLYSRGGFCILVIRTLRRTRFDLDETRTDEALLWPGKRNDAR